MKKLMIFIGLLISLSFISINAQSSIWVEVNNEAWGNNVNNIHVVDENNVWFACDFSHILHYEGTKAAANTTFPNAFTNINMYDVKFSGPDTGFVVGDLGMVVRTINGGQNWSVVHNTQKFDDLLYSVAIINNTIIAGGKKTYRSENNGNTWSEMAMPMISVKKIVTCNDTMVALSNDFDERKKIYTSYDHGNNWLITEVSMNAYSLALKSRGTGVIADKNNVAFTNNYGLTWDIKNLQSSVIINAAVYFNDMIVLGGYDGVILVSYDNGQTWENKDLPYDQNQPDILSMAVTENGTVWVGLQGGKIFKTDQLTAVDVADNPLPTDFVLNQNYPNPFNPNTIISYNLPESNNVKLTVFNSLGQEIATLINGYQNVGYHEINWQADNYSSGVYFYQLTAGKNTITKKMILSK